MKHWFPVTKWPLVAASLSVIEYGLPLLMSLVSFVVNVIIWVFILQYAFSALECRLWFTATRGVMAFGH